MIMCPEWSQDGLSATELSLQEMKAVGAGGLFIRQTVVQDPFFHVSSEITEIRHMGIQISVLLQLLLIRISVSGGWDLCN